jgi:hypothetical protein
MPSTTASPRRHQQPAMVPTTVRTTGHQQEVTLSEFYQLLQFVSGQARGLGGPVGSNVIVSSDPPLLLRPPSSVSSALNAESATTTPAAATATTTTGVSSSMTSNPLPPSSHSLPPGYLTARSFRQSTTSSSTNNNNNNNAATTTTITVAKRPTPHDDLGALVVDPGVRSDRSITTHRSHSVEVNYDNYLIQQSNHQTQRQPPPPVVVTEQPPPRPPSSSSNHALKTRSLPRNCHQPAGSQQTTASGGGGGAPVGRHWAEILALITQVLSGTDQYNNSLKQQQQQQRTAVAAAAAAGNHQIVTAGATGQTSGQTPPPSATPVKRQQQQQQQQRRPTMGDSLSDSEEAYLRRRRQASSTSPTTANHTTMTSSSRDQRHYDSLRTPRSSSRANSVANDRSSDVTGGGHQSYLASLSQRLQIEQYIVKTLTHLTKSEKAVVNSTDSSSEKDGLDGCGYIECWGSPERHSSGRGSSAGSNQPQGNQQQINNSNVGLERALLRLDQRMRADRQPRIYQHHHWRITPAECNALFLCKV